MMTNEFYGPEHASGVLRSVAGGLAILEFGLDALTVDLTPDEAEERVHKLRNAIGRCAVEAMELADELAPSAGLWLSSFGAVQEVHAERFEATTATNTDD
jgi:hypothetical protein